jgi:hypothetical protein
LSSCSSSLFHLSLGEGSTVAAGIMERTGMLLSTENMRALSAAELPPRDGGNQCSSSLESRAATWGADNRMIPQTTTPTSRSVPIEIISQILFEIITEDNLTEVVGRWDYSMSRILRRRDICSFLLVSKAIYKEASKLIQERSSIEVYLPALSSLPRLKGIGSSGIWNEFRNIKVFLRQGDRTHMGNSIRTLSILWVSLHQNTVDKQGCGGSWHQVEVICYEPDDVLASQSANLKLCSLRNESHREMLKSILNVQVWAPVLTFDHHLHLVSSANSYSTPTRLRASLRTRASICDEAQRRNNKDRSFEHVFGTWPDPELPTHQRTLSRELPLNNAERAPTVASRTFGPILSC